MIVFLIALIALFYGLGCIASYLISISELRSRFTRPSKEEKAVYGALLRTGGTIWPIVALAGIKKAVREAHEGVER